jgi:hypothetical protein
MNPIHVDGITLTMPTSDATVSDVRARIIERLTHHAE